MHLEPNIGQRLRRAPQQSVLFVLDTVLATGEESFTSKGQQVRSETQLEALFMAAGVRIHSKTSPRELHPDFREAVVWALC